MNTATEYRYRNNSRCNNFSSNKFITGILCVINLLSNKLNNIKITDHFMFLLVQFKLILQYLVSIIVIL